MVSRLEKVLRNINPKDRKIILEEIKKSPGNDPSAHIVLEKRGNYQEKKSKNEIR